ncbi:hypothetical protein AMS59_23640 [Lysinibacillus sp. FJAT-14745]|nr:hypothetical protein AMS59_23640 [Lysinibacillus sp. FJAT-14745]
MREVTFKYDPLGRRIEKSCDGKTTHFVWDGNKILHEWVEDSGYTCEGSKASTKNANQHPNDIAKSLVTWVFELDTFIPAAKITSEGNFSIISDYLGTPVGSSELNIYGRVKELTTVKELCRGSRSDMLDFEKELSEKRPGKLNKEKHAGSKLGEALSPKCRKPMSTFIVVEESF